MLSLYGGVKDLDDKILQLFEDEDGRSELEKEWEIEESQERRVITQFSADPGNITNVFLLVPSVQTI